jgi:hypothetical protein
MYLVLVPPVFADAVGTNVGFVNDIRNKTSFVFRIAQYVRAK